MSAHTPGPWKMSTDAMGSQVKGKIGGEWITVADQLDEGDARLIAAAPELLEALETVVRALENISISWGAHHEVETARAAIAKARGESK